MKMTTRILGLAVAGSVAAFAGPACDGNRSAVDGPPALFVPEDAGAPCHESLRCSSDLKKVLRHRCDGTEEVMTECAPDLGCGDGVCVDACKSAELSKGSIGCSFATVPPDAVTFDTAGSCFAALIANVWDLPVTVEATLGDKPIDIRSSTYYAEANGGPVKYTPVDGPIAVGKVAIVFLAKATHQGEISCPSGVLPALLEDPILHGTRRTRAFRLTTNVPVSAYSIWPYGGAAGAFPTATLLLPISAWDKNYVAVNTWTQPSVFSPAPMAWPFLQIVAAEDDTEVRMRPRVNIVGSVEVPGTPQGETQTWKLSRNEVLQIKQSEDMSGSPIEASKPIGVFGGADCANIPGGVSYCDVTQLQTPPVSQWGSEYALVPYRPRTSAGIGKAASREDVPWRMVGAANGTKLTYSPDRPQGAPETLDAGEVVTFTTKAIVTVRSQDKEHPFYAAMFMTGASQFGKLLGDPDFVGVIPSEQFLDHYIFFADYTFPDTTLTLVRRRTATGFHPVFLECAGEVTGFEPLDDDGEYEFTWVYLTKDGAPLKSPVGTCGYGRHEAHSDAPFSVHVWGTGFCTSYGYAGGQGSRPLHNMKGPPIR